MSSRDLRREAKRAGDGRVVRRILAIALVLDGVDRATAARSSGMDRQTLRDWVHRYNANGIEGLSDLGGKGAKPRLSPKQQAQFVAWVEAGPDPEKDGVVRWRCVDLKVRIEEEFALSCTNAQSVNTWSSMGSAVFLCVQSTPKLMPQRRKFLKKLCQLGSRYPARTC